MQKVSVETPSGMLTLRQAKSEDIRDLIDLNKRCFPAMAEENVVWTKAHLIAHQKVFPEGQIVAELDGKLVGAVASLIVDFGDNPYRPHTYAGITDGGYFNNHDPRGDTLYGADVYVDPECRGAGIGGYLYEERRKLCKRLNLRRILAGGRIVGYEAVADEMTPDAYVKAVELGEIQDLVLSFQLREGFVVRGILKHWGISGGHELRVIHTPKAKVGVLICYDCEFPEAARYLADQGAEILFVPYCTDDRPAYQRVRLCAQARAIENQIYVVTSGIIGNLPSVPAMDIHYGKAGVFTPNDFEFARDGIQAEADSNVEMLLVTDLDINDLYRSRESGSVRQRMDRRSDLFEYRYHLKNDQSDISETEDRPVELFGDQDRY